MKNSEKIAEKAAAAARESILQNTRDFVELEKREALDINKIEAMMGTAKSRMNQVLDDFYNGMINDIHEKEVIRKKKLN
jgi:hypothetical protein